MLKLIFGCLLFLFSTESYSQSVVFYPIAKDTLAQDSISYSVNGLLELTDPVQLKLELVQVLPDALNTVYSLESGFDQNLHPTNSNFNYNPQTHEFSARLGIFNTPDLMVHLQISKNGEKIEETYFK